MSTPFDPNARPSHADPDVLVDLAAGLLDAESSREWWTHLRSCPACEERMRLAVADLERGRSRTPEALRIAALRAAPRRIEQRSPAREYGLAAMGALAAAVAITLVFTHPVARPLAVGWLPPVGGAVELRGPSSSRNEEVVRQGLRAYERHDLPSAIRLLSSAPPGSDGLDELGQLYLAGAYAAQGRAQEALEVLDRLDVEHLPHPWRGEALWLRAASLGRLGRTAEARRVLEGLSGEAGDVGRRARAALEAPTR